MISTNTHSTTPLLEQELRAPRGNENEDLLSHQPKEISMRQPEAEPKTSTSRLLH